MSLRWFAGSRGVKSACRGYRQSRCCGGVLPTTHLPIKAQCLYLFTAKQAALGIALELLSVALFVIRSIAFDDKLESVTMLHVGKLISALRHGVGAVCKKGVSCIARDKSAKVWERQL